MILTKIYINNEQIDLTDEVSIPLNFNIADIREPEKRSTTWSKTVVLPGTTFNNELFSNIWNVNAVINSTGTTNFTPNFNPNLKAIAEITYNEATQFKGICQLLNVNVTDKYEIQYEVAFFGELQNVYQFFNNKYLRDINLSEFNHKYTLYNQELSWTNTSGYCYPHIDYGNQINTNFKVTEIYPAIFVKTIIDKMFLEAGFEYQSNFFNSEIFKKLIIPYNGSSDIILTYNQIRERTFRASKLSQDTVKINGSYILSNNLTFDELNTKFITFEDKTTPPNFDIDNRLRDATFPFGLGEYFNFIPKSEGTYSFTFGAKINVTHVPSTSTAYINNYRILGRLVIYKQNGVTGRGEIIASQNVIMKPNGSYVNANGALNINANANSNRIIVTGSQSNTVNTTLIAETFINQSDEVRAGFIPTTRTANETPFIYSNDSNSTSNQTLSDNSYCNIHFLTDTYFLNAVKNSKIIENETIEIKQILPDKIKQSDFFNSIIKMFNLFIEVDNANPNKLIIEPRPIFYSSGTVQDWSDKLDYLKETKIIPLGELNNKRYTFKYKEDQDYFNNDYQITYQQSYGTKYYDIQNDFLKGEVLTELIFSPTPLVNTIGHDRVISKIYTLDTNATIKPTQSNIRILYYGGLKNTNFPWSHTATSGTTIRSNYAYAGHLNDWENPTFDLSFDIPKQVYYTTNRYTANNLYNKYWKDYMEQIADKNSKIFAGYFLINEFDIQKLDFRDTFFFENEYWRLNKIIDYDRINNQSTKCEFIKLK